MDEYFEKEDIRWRSLPLGKRYNYFLYSFLGYLILTTVVFFKVFYDKGKSNHRLVMEQIENPFLKNKESAIP